MKVSRWLADGLGRLTVSAEMLPQAKWSKRCPCNIIHKKGTVILKTHYGMLAGYRPESEHQR